MNTLANHGITLRLAHRDPRLNRHGPARWQFLPRQAGSRAAAFAARLTARYLGRLGGAPRVWTAFQQPAPGFQVHSHHHHAAYHLAPRLSLTLLAYPGAAAEQSPGRPGLPFPASRAPGLPPTWELVRRPAGIPRLAQVLQRVLPRQQALAPRAVLRQAQRLVGRAERLAMVNSPGSPLSPPPGPSLAIHPGVALTPAIIPAQPVARQLRRSPNFALQDDLARPDERQRHPHDSRQQAARSQALDIDSIDLNRLTDKVVQNLDRRITAFRERTGRV